MPAGLRARLEAGQRELPLVGPVRVAPVQVGHLVVQQLQEVRLQPKQAIRYFEPLMLQLPSPLQQNKTCAP
jgi:hypothetical protein